MKVTPLDIRRKEFKRSVRGYSDEEVDLFLDEVADEFERLFQENVELQERVRRLEEQLVGNDQLRGALEKTLVSAQIQADQTRANAQKESELVLRDAELKARGIVSDSYSEVQRVQQALIHLKHLEEDFRFKFRSLLEGHLKLLEEAPISMVPAQAAVAEPTVTAEQAGPFVVPTAIDEIPEFAAVAPSEGTLESSAAAGTAATAATAAGGRASSIGPQEAAQEVGTDKPYFSVETPVAGSSEAVAIPTAGASFDSPPRVASEESDGTEATVVADIPDPEEDTWTGSDRAQSETVEQAAVLAEAERAQTEETPAAAGEETRAGVAGDDPLSGFFFGRTSDLTEDVFLDGDKGGKSKPRDFEW